MAALGGKPPLAKAPGPEAGEGEPGAVCGDAGAGAQRQHRVNL